MGQVIPLQREARRRPPSVAPGGEAQILFFLGVRYCRDDTDGQGGEPMNTEPKKPTNSRSRRKKRA